MPVMTTDDMMEFSLKKDQVYESFLHDNWFIERWNHYGMTYKIKKILHEEDTPYQKILILKTVNFGNVMVLDGITQCSEADEFIYQEMIAHLPLSSHPNPENILIIGGGDGGVLREVVKHPSVKSVTLCEIDQRVIDLSKQYFPTMAVSLDHPKAKVVVCDGNEFLKANKLSFDIIITDSSDPVGPNEVLFTDEHSSLLKQGLKADGILCSQGDCIWVDSTLGMRLKSYSKIFPVVRYSSVYMPTYPSGQIGLILASKSKDAVLEQPLREYTQKEIEQFDLKYYDSAVHRASFVLPKYMKKMLNLEKTSGQMTKHKS